MKTTIKKILQFAVVFTITLSTITINPIVAKDVSSELSDEEFIAPIMGWASWNAFRINLNEEKIKEQTDLMVELGFQDAGYSFINIDDGFFGGRDENGKLYPNDKFKSGMRSIADYIHDKGFNAGIYTDAGIQRCASYWDNDPNFNEGGGTYGYRDIDFKTFFLDWDFDFVKVDWCGGDWQGLDLETEYTDIANKIAEVGKEVFWELCSWAFPGEWAIDKATHWRISQDINPRFSFITDIIDKSNAVRQYSSPGHYNHMDMLEVGNGMSYEEDKSHFTMWSIMNSPLLISTDLSTLKQETIDILTNTEIIALNQDNLGIQAEIVKKEGPKEVWAKPVKNYTKSAITFFNRSNETQEMSISWTDIGLNGKAFVRDLWAHEDLGEFEDQYTTLVPAHGVVVLEVGNDELVIQGSKEFDKDNPKELFFDVVENTVESITYNGEILIENKDYQVIGNKIKFTIDLLSRLKSGNNKLLVHYNNNITQEIPIFVTEILFTSENLGSGNSQSELAKLFDGIIEEDISGNFPFPGGLPEDKEVNIQYNFKKNMKVDSIDFWTNYGNQQGLRKFKLAIWDLELQEWSILDKEYELNWKTAVTEPVEKLKVSVNIPETTKIKIIITGIGNSWGKMAMREIGFNTSQVVDLSELQDTINKAEEIDQSIFTKESVDVLLEAIKIAKQAISNPNITEAQVGAALAGLNRAIAELELIPEVDTSELEQLLELAKKYNSKLFTENTFNILLDAIQSAETLLNNVSTQELIDAEVYKLTKAIDQLQKLEIDDSKLINLLEKAKQYDKKLYTNESFEKLESMITDIENLLLTELTQEEINNLIKELNNVIDNLELVKVNPEEPEKPVNPNKPESPTKKEDVPPTGLANNYFNLITVLFVATLVIVIQRIKKYDKL